MSASALRLAQERISEAAILLAAGASAEQIADVLLQALDALDALERDSNEGGETMRASTST